LDEKSLLILEDEALIAMELEGLAEEHGAHFVRAVPTIAQARSFVEKERFDLAVLDVRLPDGTSLPLAHELLGRGIGVVFHSGHLGRQDLENGLDGAAFCSKPCPPEHLIATLAKVANGSFTADR
jgi:DNA-binding response OmpR family regulator